MFPGLLLTASHHHFHVSMGVRVSEKAPGVAPRSGPLGSCVSMWRVAGGSSDSVGGWGSVDPNTGEADRWDANSSPLSPSAVGVTGLGI